MKNLIKTALGIILVITMLSCKENGLTDHQQAYNDCYTTYSTNVIYTKQLLDSNLIDTTTFNNIILSLKETYEECRDNLK